MWCTNWGQLCWKICVWTWKIRRVSLATERFLCGSPYLDIVVQRSMVLTFKAGYSPHDVRLVMVEFNPPIHFSSFICIDFWHQLKGLSFAINWPVLHKEFFASSQIPHTNILKSFLCEREIVRRKLLRQLPRLSMVVCSISCGSSQIILEDRRRFNLNTLQ